MAVREAEIRTTEAEIEEFVGKALGDMGSALTASLVVIGDKLGLYRGLDAGGPQIFDLRLAQGPGGRLRRFQLCQTKDAGGAEEFGPPAPL